MALYREDIVNIELNSGTIFRSFMAHAIGEGDSMANRFGVRLFRDGEPVVIGSGQCEGFFMAPDGTNILISGSSYTGVDGNKAWVQLPQGCYAYEGQFCLAIKLIDSSVTGTMRIVDGMVDNTGATGAVMPTSQVPTSAEIIAAYEDAVGVIDNSVRFDITQSLTEAQKEKARENTDSANKNVLDQRMIDPLIQSWNSIEYTNTSETPEAGLMSTALVVWGSDYPQYYGHYDIEVNPGEFYVIEGTAFHSGYKAYMLCNNNTVVYYEKNDPVNDFKFRNIIQIPDGVNRLIVNFGKQSGDASSQGIAGIFNGLNFLDKSNTNLNAINPDTFNWENYIIDEEESSAGLITNALIVVSTQYPQYYKYFDIQVTPGDIYAVEGMWYNAGYYPVMLAKDDVLMYYPLGAFPETDAIYRNIITIPDGVNRLLVNGAVERGVGKCGHIIGNRTSKTGQKIVWFGTSIPAGNANAGGGNVTSSYPMQIGAAIGATVYNEAVGSSCVRGGNHNNKTADDPLGYGGMDLLQLMLSLSLSSTEKQAILDDWDSKWSQIIPDATVIDRSAAAVQNYKNCSWDIKLAKYLTGGSVGQVDMYVFDHGYNDGIATAGFTDLELEPGTVTDRSYFYGAMNFLVKKILNDNPKAQIVIIGHYNYDTDPFGRGANFAGKHVCDAQAKYAQKWGIPIVKTWEMLGISMNTITVNGSETTVLQSWFPDKLHPSSDTTGKALTHYANALTPAIRNLGW